MSSPIDIALNDLADEFELLGDWEERYRYVIELGKDLEPLTDAERSEENKVRGCASQVWLVTEPQADGSVTPALSNAQLQAILDDDIGRLRDKVEQVKRTIKVIT